MTVQLPFPPVFHLDTKLDLLILSISRGMSLHRKLRPIQTALLHHHHQNVQTRILLRHNPQTSPTSRRLHLPHLPTGGPPSTHTLTAARHLPYPPLPLYEVITDVASYPAFLPYCLAARVTRWSPRRDAAHARRWPEQAALRVGYGELTEEFASRVVCCPPPGTGDGRGTVEALAGDATARAEGDVAHHDNASLEAGADEEGGPLARLRTTWVVEGQGEGRGSEVKLEIEYAFRSAVYDMLGSAVAGRVAEQVVDAFEGRVRDVLGKGQGQS